MGAAEACDMTKKESKSTLARKRLNVVFTFLCETGKNDEDDMSVIIQQMRDDEPCINYP